MQKTILGLDLGTNSIGWALTQQNFETEQGKILGLGSRIIPMSQDVLGDFGKGNSVSQTAERTRYRSMRRLRERHLLRRERLHRVLNIIGFLPKHFANQIDFEKYYGKFKSDNETKLPYDANGFIFKNSFEEMLLDFQKYQPQILKNEKGEDKLVPYDWTIFYLRKKALTQKIEKEELAWILLNFNQKRGYYQLRGEEEEENENKLIEYHSLKIMEVTADEPQRGKPEIWYSLLLENGWTYRRSSKTPLFDWKNKVRDFIVTTDMNEDGSIKMDKDGKEKRSFRAPLETDWTLVKKKTEQEINTAQKTVGAYIYDTLLQNPKQKIKGRLVRTIERKFYKAELKEILEKQKEFHPELRDERLYHNCVRDLYKQNAAHQAILSNKDFIYLFLEDIIFYQRPLRSQKTTIANCPLESRKYRDKNGCEHTRHLKAISKSNPLYQEFRIWQWMYNLVIYKKEDDANVTDELLQSSADFEGLFEFLSSRKEIDQKSMLKFLLERKGFKSKLLSEELERYRWNYVEDKKYPTNETGMTIASRLAKVNHVPEHFLTREIEQKIWHIIYSVHDKVEYEKALKSFAKKNNLDQVSFQEAFQKFPPFKSEYGAFSEKAIKKLLPLMRVGKFWDEDEIVKNSNTYFANIEPLLSDLARRQQNILEDDQQQYNRSINNQLKNQLEILQSAEIQSFQKLRLHIAQYLVYGRHSEAAFAGKWTSPDELEDFLREFKQHSLRNPIVEQVVTEALRVVIDIWTQYGNSAKDFFSEIHIELGREMKQTKAERESATKRITENENTNLRIKALLAEMINDDDAENVRPYSPLQQELLKIYEEGVLNSEIEIDDDIFKISKTAQPTLSDLKRYRLWLEQKYRSPYTGEIIPLSKLFTPEYEIEHIIPQSRYFDDSLSNKIICESAVNKLKDNYTGLAFIKEFGGTKVECGRGKTVTVFKQDLYEDFVKRHYAKNRGKRNKLLMEDIPEKMIERQMNDTRYISKYISGILSNIVRAEDGSDQGLNSKNIIPVTGKITTELKRDWGLNDIWNDLILPRFERMNQLTNSKDFTVWHEYHQKYLPTVPIEYSRGFSKKRIDHRHHALDALVIACATREHVNLLNNLSANANSKRFDLKKKLMKFERVTYRHPHTGEKIERSIPKQFLKPWEGFTIDAKNNLQNIIVSFKQNLRVINKATNYYEKYIEQDGTMKKGKVAQNGTNWAIRKPLHKDTVSGKVDLPWIRVPKGKILTATRKSLDTSFNQKTIGSITDTGIQKILRNYLAEKGSAELAFSPEGIEDLNKNISKYNDGKDHQPIIKVRVFETGSKFPVGYSGNKKEKYVEAAKGTNLFFGIYRDNKGKRSFETIPLNIVIERQKQGLRPVPDTNSEGDNLLFHLSPNDLVYVPNEDNEMNFQLLQNENIPQVTTEFIYKVVSFTGNQIFFIRQEVASPIVNKSEFSTLNKMERALTGKMIKEHCVKLEVDRLGTIKTMKL